jgi:hypothetical protein
MRKRINTEDAAKARAYTSAEDFATRYSSKQGTVMTREEQIACSYRRFDPNSGGTRWWDYVEDDPNDIIYGGDE